MSDLSHREIKFLFLQSKACFLGGTRVNLVLNEEYRFWEAPALLQKAAGIGKIAYIKTQEACASCVFIALSAKIGFLNCIAGGQLRTGSG